jgi:hypothetical protein
MKKCSKCGEVKVLTEYSKDKTSKDGLNYTCKICSREKAKQHSLSNPGYYTTNSSQHYYHNKEHYNELARISRKRRATDPKYKLISSLRVRLYKVLGGGRSRRSLEVLGCSPEEYRQHLECRFEPWMTWENKAGHIVQGPNMVWDVDHIIPVSSAQTEEDIYRLFHYTNLKPLCAHYNRFVKRNKI